MGVASIFSVLNDILSPYGVSFSFPTLAGDGPDWWKMRKALLTAGAYTLQLLPSSDAEAIARVTGWYSDTDATPDIATPLADGDYLRTPVTVWWTEGGVVYPHSLSGFPVAIEERHVSQYGEVAVMAGAPVKELDLSISMVAGDNVLRLTAEMGGLPADASLWSTGVLMASDAQHHHPALYLRVDDESVSAGGLKTAVSPGDVKQTVQGWTGLYDVTLHLTGVEETVGFSGGFPVQF